MKIKDRAKPKTPPVEPGVYMAVCVGIVDLGEQYSEKFKSYSNKVKFVWALPGETITIDGKEEERQLSKEFTLSIGKKGALRGFLESWNGCSYTDEEFGELDLFGQLGKACQLQVVLNDTKEYSNVANLMPIPRGMPVPQSRSEMYTWDMERWNDALFEKLPEWTRDQIKKSTQYQKTYAPVTDVAVAGAANGGTPSVSFADSSLREGAEAISPQSPQGSQGLGGTNGGIATAFGFAMTGNSGGAPF